MDNNKLGRNNSKAKQQEQQQQQQQNSNNISDMTLLLSSFGGGFAPPTTTPFLQKTKLKNASNSKTPKTVIVVSLFLPSFSHSLFQKNGYHQLFLEMRKR